MEGYRENPTQRYTLQHDGQVATTSSHYISKWSHLEVVAFLSSGKVPLQHDRPTEAVMCYFDLVLTLLPGDQLWFLLAPWKQKHSFGTSC